MLRWHPCDDRPEGPFLIRHPWQDEGPPFGGQEALGIIILESLGRLFKNDLKLYVYPLKEQKSGSPITASNLRVAPNFGHLYSYLVENRLIESMRDFNETCLHAAAFRCVQAANRRVAPHRAARHAK